DRERAGPGGVPRGVVAAARPHVHRRRRARPRPARPLVPGRDTPRL
ncbi:MAG: hypothetical protein AVDCRST_MAG85-1901, partial [uncultured Solirubrobacteraceae bacterium]